MRFLLRSAGTGNKPYPVMALIPFIKQPAAKLDSFSLLPSLLCFMCRTCLKEEAKLSNKSCGLSSSTRYLQSPDCVLQCSKAVKLEFKLNIFTVSQAQHRPRDPENQFHCKTLVFIMISQTTPASVNKLVSSTASSVWLTPTEPDETSKPVA